MDGGLNCRGALEPFQATCRVLATGPNDVPKNTAKVTSSACESQERK